MENEKIAVVIPAYEPPMKFINYLSDLMCGGADSVIVVNDGSSTKYQEVFDKAKDISGVTVLEYSENHGKGYALKHAFSYVRERFSENTVIVTADCDGQHSVSDVLRLAKSSSENKDCLILGARDFSSPNVPKRSRFGNLNTRRMFSLLYGLKVTDTQTGLRAFSYAMLDKMLAISGNRFEYEMNMLIVLFKQNVEFKEIPIETIYEKKPDDVERRSHFKTITDSVKVWSVLLKNVNFYLIGVVLSTVVEFGIYSLCIYLAYAGLVEETKLLLSAVTSRILSSIVNYFINCKFVFNGKGKSTIVRYYTLWVCLITATTLITTYLNVFNLSPVFFKLIVDVVLAIISFRVQTVWVFSHKTKKQ